MGHINLIRFLSPFYTHISDHYISVNHKCFCLFYLYDIKRLKRINMNANTVWWLYNTFCIGDFETNVTMVVYFISFLFVCFDDCNLYQNRYCSNPKYKGCLVKDNFELDVSLLMSWWCDLLCFWNNLHHYALCDNKWIWNIKQVSKRWLSTLYTNLPLDVIYDSLRVLIIKMFANGVAVSVMVNSNRKKNILVEWVKLCWI